MSELPVGSSIKNTYVIQSVLFLERGFEGPTYVVIDRVAEETFLCQDVGPSGSPYDDHYRQALDVLKGLHHPNLASVHETFSMGGREYLVLEAAHTESLEKAVHVQGDAAGNRALRDWADQICDAFAAIDSGLPCLILDQLDPGEIMGDAQGRFQIVNYHLGRCFQNNGHVLGDKDEDRAVNYRTCADLLAFIATRKKSKADLNALRAANLKLAAVIQRCQAFLQYPGLSFAEIKRSVWQALPEEPVEKRSKLEMESLGVLHILKTIPFKNWLIIATVVAVLSGVRALFKLHQPQWGIQNSAAYAITSENSVQFVDGDTYRESHTLDLQTQQPDITDIKIIADGQKLLVCNKGGREVDCFDTDTHHQSAYLKFSYAPQMMLTGFHSRTAWVIGGGRAEEISIAPAFLIKRGVSLGVTRPDSVYAMTPDRAFIFVSIPNLHQIRVIDVNNLKILREPIQYSGTPRCMNVSPDGKELWIANAKGGTTAVLSLDALLNEVNPSGVSTIATLTAAGADFKPVDVEFSGDGSQAAIVSSETNQILVVNMAGHKVAGTAVTQGKYPVHCCFGPGTLWVADEDSKAVEVITLGSLSTFKTIRVDGSPSMVQFVQLTGK
ncbi:MAG TPA: hypothetical protein VGO93_17640 [Candidatus Xenobia bacterium]